MYPYRIFYLLAFACLGGCLDISSRSAPKLWEGYDPGDVYVTAVDLFIMKVDDGMAGERIALVPTRQPRTPHSTTLYGAPFGSATEENCHTLSDCVGILPAATFLKPSRVERHHGLNWWYGKHDDIILFAVFTESKQGIKEVDITDLSIFYESKDSPNEGPFLFSPNPTLLHPDIGQ